MALREPRLLQVLVEGQPRAHTARRRRRPARNGGRASLQTWPVQVPPLRTGRRAPTWRTPELDQARANITKTDCSHQEKLDTRSARGEPADDSPRYGDPRGIQGDVYLGGSMSQRGALHIVKRSDAQWAAAIDR